MSFNNKVEFEGGYYNALIDFYVKHLLMNRGVQEKFTKNSELLLVTYKDSRVI